ncbi:putative dehydrogenase [Paenibacillus sp. OAE614]
MPKTIQWGILGTGWIASQFTKDLAFAENGVAAAVGSRTLDSASRFAADYGIGKAYGSYEELANDPDIDAIYVATPHPAHKENVLLCLKAGKAVLCEKPFTVNAGRTGRGRILCQGEQGFSDGRNVDEISSGHPQSEGMAG